MIESVTLRGLLSYGWEPLTLPLRALNLIIGTNGSGKTNLIDALDVARWAPIDALAPMGNKGGEGAWLHKGPGGDGQAMIELVFDGATPLRYRLVLQFDDAQRPRLASEILETRDDHGGEAPFSFFQASPGIGGGARVNFKLFQRGLPLQDPLFGDHQWRESSFHGVSALSHLRGNPLFPQVFEVAEQLQRIHLFQGWTLGPGSPVRRMTDAGLPGQYLEPDGNNLALVVDRLHPSGEAWSRILTELRSLYPQIDDIETSVEGPVVKLALREQGLSAAVPAGRISDGTLRWLALLCLLLDPDPPPLLCLEEPEIGLHPDLIVRLAALLREAAERTQLIVTTHSDLLVSEFSDTPEDVVVCEREAGGTTLRRLDRDQLAPWLETYRLGDAWLRNAFGGTRW